MFYFHFPLDIPVSANEHCDFDNILRKYVRSGRNNFKQSRMLGQRIQIEKFWTFGMFYVKQKKKTKEEKISLMVFNLIQAAIVLQFSSYSDE